MRGLLDRAMKALPEEKERLGFDQTELSDLMTRKKWNAAARKLIEFGEAQEKNDQQMGINFWEPLARATTMMKMGDVIMLCRRYRDGSTDRPENRVEGRF